MRKDWKNNKAPKTKGILTYKQIKELDDAWLARYVLQEYKLSEACYYDLGYARHLITNWMNDNKNGKRFDKTLLVIRTLREYIRADWKLKRVIGNIGGE